MARAERDICYLPFRGRGDAFWRSWVGGIVLRPWYDKIALPTLARFYFPLSRAWAEALDEEASPRPRGQGGLVGKKTDNGLNGAIHAARAKWSHYQRIAHDWEETIFSEEPASSQELKKIQKRRKRAAFTMMNARSGFISAHVRESFPAVKNEIESYDAVRKRHGSRLEGAVPAFEMPDEPPPLKLSQSVEGKYLRKSWLKGPSPMGDTMWARLSIPKEREKPVGTLILSHGVGMEDEFWGSRIPKLVGAQGMRALSPEGPWHGRRRIDGFYGGEPLFARGAGGLLDYLHAHVRELGIYTRWVRENIGGLVAVGGVSLGALSAQVVVTAARDWPEIYRPDVFFLVTPSPSIKAVAFEGRLTRSLGLTEAVLAHGWTPDNLDHWAPLMEPLGHPSVDPERLIFIVGNADDITPAHAAKIFIDRWRLPEFNRFIRPQGHFTTALGIMRDPAPLGRLADIMAGL